MLVASKRLALEQRRYWLAVMDRKEPFGTVTKFGGSTWKSYKFIYFYVYSCPLLCNLNIFYNVYDLRISLPIQQRTMLWVPFLMNRLLLCKLSWERKQTYPNPDLSYWSPFIIPVFYHEMTLHETPCHPLGLFSSCYSFSSHKSNEYLFWCIPNI